MHGIHPRRDGARAESVVISGGYPDDCDFGNVIIFTGAGGQSAPGSGIQIADQKMEGANKAMVRAQYDATPVHVIRGAGGDPKFSPVSGYRYDGLYDVMDHWWKKSAQGWKVMQFLLESIDPSAPSTVGGPIGGGAPPSGKVNPDRRDRRFRGLVRDQKNVDWIKNCYDNTCQVCRTQLITDAGPISIAAHIQGLGQPHNGPDVVENMLCLCHNCHAIFDSGAFCINDDCKTITWLHKPVGREESIYSSELFTKPGHNVGQSYVRHHRLNVAGIAD